MVEHIMLAPKEAWWLSSIGQRKMMSYGVTCHRNRGKVVEQCRVLANKSRVVDHCHVCPDRGRVAPLCHVCPHRDRVVYSSFIFALMEAERLSTVMAVHTEPGS